MSRRNAGWWLTPRGYSHATLSWVCILSALLAGMTIWLITSSYFAAREQELKDNIEYLEALAQSVRRERHSLPLQPTKPKEKKITKVLNDETKPVKGQEPKGELLPQRAETQQSAKERSIHLHHVISFSAIRNQVESLNRWEYWGNMSKQTEGLQEIVSVIDANYAGEVAQPGDKPVFKNFFISAVLEDAFKKLKEQEHKERKENIQSLMGATLVSILRAADKKKEGELKEEYLLFSLVHTSLDTGILRREFYRKVQEDLMKESGEVAIIAVHSESKTEPFGLQSFVFPLRWLRLFQLGGVLHSPVAVREICGLMGYNLGIIAEETKSKILVKEYPLAKYAQAILPSMKTETTISDTKGTSTMLERVWNHIQATDAYYSLHPHPLFPTWHKGLTAVGCRCSDNAVERHVIEGEEEGVESKEEEGEVLNENVEEKQETVYICSTLARAPLVLREEHRRACNLTRAMRKWKGPKATLRIPISYRPNFVLGDWRNFHNIQSCSQHFARYKPGLPVTNLASFPRSGNTWLRQLLERATGVLTGSIYKDIRLKEAGLLGEMTTENVLVVKEHHHHLYSNVYPHFKSDRAIHITRNPFAAIESHYHYVYSGTHDKSTENRGKQWLNYVKEQTPMWTRFQKWWLHAPSKLGIPVLRVSYEDLARNTTGELKRILDFLGFNDVSEERILCAAATPCQARTACRARDRDKEVDHFDEALTAFVLQDAGEVMKEYGYEGKPIFGGGKVSP